jgi:hypothetical protein
MAELALSKTPRARELPRRVLLRRARISAHLRLRHKHASYRVIPALIMEVTSYVTLAVATTCWASAQWPALRSASPLMRAPSRLNSIELSLAMATLLLTVATLCALVSRASARKDMSSTT